MMEAYSLANQQSAMEALFANPPLALAFFSRLSFFPKFQNSNAAAMKILCTYIPYSIYENKSEILFVLVSTYVHKHLCTQVPVIRENIPKYNS